MTGSQKPDFTILSAETVPISIPWYRRAFQLGPGPRLRKRVAEILLLRNPADVQAAWNSTSVDIDLAAKVSGIIAEWCEWPNALFVPDDECAYLFLDVEYDLSIVGAKRQIEKDIVPNLNQDVWSKLDSLSYGEFIGHIQAGLSD
jgi:hypothetical protein